MWARAADARSKHRRIVAVIDEQWGNDLHHLPPHQMLAIRQARTRIASASAAQTISSGAWPARRSGQGAFLAATAAAGLRIFTPMHFARNKKGLGSTEAFDASR
jgi:hypothetical protein